MTNAVFPWIFVIAVAMAGCASRVAKKDPIEPAPVTNGDTDGDGIADVVDKCPTEPEDRDGFEDEDGCSDPDNDRDGVPDVTDKCPNEPMIRHGGVDPSHGSGCPDDLRPPIVLPPK